MYATFPFGARHDPTAIRRHSRYAGRLRVLWLETLLGVCGRLLLQMFVQLLSDHAAEFHYLGNADRHLRQFPQHLLRFVRGLVFRIRRNDLVQNRGTIAPLVETQSWTLREKNLGDKPSNDKSVREGPADRQWSPKYGRHGPADTSVRRWGKAVAP